MHMHKKVNIFNIKLKKKDTLLAIMKKYSLRPIYGKKGYLKEILKLNPHKIHTKGNLIYPGETLTIPIIKYKNRDEKKHNNIAEFSTAVNYKYQKELDNITKLPKNYVYLVYKVKKNDMISVLLKKYKSFPIYGKKGTLFKTLELNPNKKPTKGDLIFPGEYINLPIPVEMLQQFSAEEKNNLKIIHFNEDSNKHEELTFNEYSELAKKQDKIETNENSINSKNNLVNEKENSIKPQKENEKNISNNILQEKNLKVKLFAKIKNKQVILKWLRKENKTFKYEIRKSINKENDFLTFESNFYGNKLIDYDIILGQTYYYQVIGIDKYGHKFESNIVKILPPPTEPKNLVAKLIENSAYLTWEQSHSKTQISYEIYRSIHSQKGYFLLKKDINSNTFTDKTIKPGYTYFYKVKVVDNEGNSNISNEAQIHSYPSKVKLLGFLKKDYIYLEWNKELVRSEISYDIYRSEHDNKNFKLIYSNYKGNFARDREIVKNEIYYYKILAKNIDGVTIESNTIELFTNLDNIFLQYDIDNKKIKLFWNKVYGSNKLKYNIYKSEITLNNFSLIKENTIINHYDDTDILDGHKYIYKIIGTDKLNKTTESNTVVVVINPKKLDNIKANLIDKINVQISWTIPNSNIATKFKILKSYLPDKNFLPITSEITKDSYLDKNCKPGHKIFYKLVAINENGIAVESDIISIITTPERPEKINGRLNKKENTIEWEKVESNLPVLYEIYRGSQTIDSIQYLTSISDTNSYIDKNIEAEKDYFYVLKAKVEKLSSSFSDIVQITSHTTSQIPSALEGGFGLSYFKMHEYNKNIDSHADLYSAASTNTYITLNQNWDENFSSFFGFGSYYLDMLDSPIYMLSERQFFLPYFLLGIKNEFSNHILLEYKNMFQTEIYYQSNLTGLQRTMQNNSVYVDNHFFNLGYDFSQNLNLHLFAKIGYIMSVPEAIQFAQIGHGYQLELEMVQQFSQYELGIKGFYTNRTIKTNNVDSTISENGILIHFAIDLGYL